MDRLGILLVLTFLGLVSPLLTFARLFQMKEWRIDRLREHLRREGVFRQLFGVLRPTILFLAILLHVLGIASWIHVALVGFAIVSLVKVLMRRQQVPVWTMKARLIVGTSATLSFVLTPMAEGSGWMVLPLLIVLQPAFVLIAWALWYPVDALLKRRILRTARALRACRPKDVVIGIAGSVGKTTTKELLAHLLSDRKPFLTPLHVNTELGVATWITRILCGLHAEESRVFLVELGDYRQGEIALMCSYVQPTIGVVTYVGLEHLALFGSEDAIAESKRELLRALPAEGHAFLNADNPACMNLASASRAPWTTVGTTKRAHFQAIGVRDAVDGLHFQCEGHEFHITLRGEHHITNVLLAMSVAMHLGVSVNRMKELLRTFRGLEHSFVVKEEGGVLLLDDTYNATPMSVQAGIDWARAQDRSPKILFTSGVMEMGREEDRVHESLGRSARGVFDRVVFIGIPGKAAFERGYGKKVELYTPSSRGVSSGSLLACIGRLPMECIRSLLRESALADA